MTERMLSLLMYGPAAHLWHMRNNHRFASWYMHDGTIAHFAVYTTTALYQQADTVDISPC